MTITNETTNQTETQTPTQTHPQTHAQVTCSFCKKSSDQVKKVIAGPDGVTICNECVGLCRDILDEQLGSDTR